MERAVYINDLAAQRVARKITLELPKAQVNVMPAYSKGRQMVGYFVSYRLEGRHEYVKE